MQTGHILSRMNSDNISVDDAVGIVKTLINGSHRLEGSFLQD